MKKTFGNLLIYFHIKVGIGSLCIIITGFIVFKDLERRGSNKCFIQDTTLITYMNKLKFLNKKENIIIY